MGGAATLPAAPPGLRRDGLGATVHWAIQREDLTARRFDRAFTSVFWNT